MSTSGLTTLGLTIRPTMSDDAREWCLCSIATVVCRISSFNKLEFGVLQGEETERSVQLSCGEHTDYGLLTLVNQEEGVTALQVSCLTLCSTLAKAAQPGAAGLVCMKGITALQVNCLVLCCTLAMVTQPCTAGLVGHRSASESSHALFHPG